MMKKFNLYEIDSELFKIADELFFVYIEDIYEYYRKNNASQKQENLPSEVQNLIDNFMAIFKRIDVVHRFYAVIDALQNGCPIVIAEVWYFKDNINSKELEYLWDDYLINEFFCGKRE